MGGTGGPGSDQTMSQQGLMGAGLLSGTPDEQATKSVMLGVDSAAQPTSSQLMGAGAGDTSIPATSVSDTPALTQAAGATGPPTINFGSPGNTGLANPATPAFNLAGQGGNLGFPTGTTPTSPLGEYTHVGFGTQLGDTATTGKSITGAPVTGPAAGPAAPEYEFDMDAFMRDGAAYNRANAAWGKPELRPDAFSNLNKSYMKLKGT